MSNIILRPHELKSRIAYFNEYVYKLNEPLIKRMEIAVKGYLFNTETGIIETIYHDWFIDYKKLIDEQIDAKKKELGL